MLAAEVSLYPQKAKDCDQVISKSIEALGKHGLDFKTGTVSTFVQGDTELVWSGLRSLFEEAGKQGCEVNMVVQLRQIG